MNTTRFFSGLCTALTLVAAHPLAAKQTIFVELPLPPPTKEEVQEQEKLRQQQEQLQQQQKELAAREAALKKREQAAASREEKLQQSSEGLAERKQLKTQLEEQQRLLEQAKHSLKEKKKEVVDLRQQIKSKVIEQKQVSEQLEEQRQHLEKSKDSLEMKTDEIARLRQRLNQCSQFKTPSGKTYTDKSTDMEFVYVKGGCFQMGDIFGDGADDEKPGDKEVCVSDFYIGKYEVTQRQYQQIMETNPSESRTGDKYPVDNVSWYDSEEFIARLNAENNTNYRLPSEAEWEYAARSGGKAERYSGSNRFAAVSWYSKNSGGHSHEVGTKKANGLGIHDMSGNVWEWCQDTWHDSYKGGPTDGSAWETGDGSYRVIRGGGWINSPRDVRAAYRGSSGPDGDYGLGFRLVFSVH